VETFDFDQEIILACTSGIKELEAIMDYTQKIQSTQSDDMKQVYTDNRADELPHLQNLAVALTAMVNSEDPAVAARMDDAARIDGFGDSKGDKRITIDCNDQSNGFQELLEYLKNNSDGGHSFNIVVDPGDPEREKTFGLDGDGADRIYSIEVEKTGGGDDE
jgi:hypothetical protein